MALTTVRAPEVIGRNSEKPQSSFKHVAGPLAQAQQVTLQETTNLDGRDGSPSIRSSSRHSGTGTVIDQASCVSAQPRAEGYQQSQPSDAPCPVTRSAPMPPVEIKLDNVPSFAEQRPERTKPLFIERHGTLKNVHLTLSGNAPSDTSPDFAPTPDLIQRLQAIPALCQILPGWEIARSKLWLLLEAALPPAQAGPVPPRSASSSSSSSSPPSSSLTAASLGSHARAQHPVEPPFPNMESWTPALATVLESSALSSSTQSYSAPSASDPSLLAPCDSAPDEPSCSPSPSSGTQEHAQPLAHATPFARRPTQLTVVKQTMSLPPAALAAMMAAEAKALVTPSTGAPLPSPFGRCASHTTRPCPPVPLGLGPLPLTPSLSTSSRSSMSRLLHHRASVNVPPRGPYDSDVVQHQHEMAGCPGAVIAAADSLGDGPPQDPQRDPQQQGSRARQVLGEHRLAYAAGVAAATSTATAVSHALSAASGGLTAAVGGLTVLADPHGTALQLGADAVHAGTTFFMNKLQSVAINKMTVAAAEAVLGPSASVTLRDSVRQRLRATLAGASVLWFCFNVHNMSDMLSHLDFEHDFVTSAKVVMNLAVGGPSFMENCRELLKIGVAVGLGVAERSAVVGGNSDNNGGGGEGAMEAVSVAVERA